MSLFNLTPRFALPVGLLAAAALIVAISLVFRGQPCEMKSVFITLSHHDVRLLQQELARDRRAIERKDLDGNTPLHIAALDGWTEAVRVLLDAGADPNGVNARGHTPVHLALNASANQYDIIRALVAAGADPCTPLPNGRSARQAAESLHHVDPRVLPLLAPASRTVAGIR